MAEEFDGGDIELIGDRRDDMLTGRSEPDSFDCGPGADTITDFNVSEGDTKTESCENFLANVSAINDSNAAIDTPHGPSHEVVVDFAPPVEDVSYYPPHITLMVKTATKLISNNQNNNETTTRISIDKSEY
ncbi:MAG TPA: hypothetical protein VJ695_03325 [Nitrososphaera sp.]|nr:hypothetical protein [Nitrososphaera sp.]